ncbi:MAG: hypothetical protein V3U29_00490, partial [Phycisphaeraceae bacterium]
MLGSQRTTARLTRLCQIGTILLCVPILMAIACPLTVTVTCPDDGTAGTAATVTVSVSFGQGGSTWTTDAANGTVADGDTETPSVTPTAGGTVTVTVTATDDAGDTATGTCEFTAAPAPCTVDTQAVDCNDNDACTNDVCVDSVCQNNAVDCPDQVCNPADGSCVDCLDDGDCEADEACDGTVCRTTCDPDAVDPCDDGLVCTVDACSETGTDTGIFVCQNTAVTCADDGDLCTTEACTEPDGCASTPKDCGDQVCNPDDGECVDCLTNADCDAGAGETCENNLCVAPVGFGVSIGGCPAANVGEGSTTTLTASSSGEQGTVTFGWSATGSLTLDTTTGDTVVVTAGPTAGVVKVTGTDTFVIDDGGTPDDPSDDTTDTDTATDSCSIGVETVLTVNAGPDRDLIPLPFPVDFTGGAFVAGSQLFSAVPPAAPTATAPQLVAIADDPVFDDVEINFLWEYLSGPAAAADVVILVPTGAVSAYLIIPALANLAPTLAVDGQAATVANTVIPGPYTFRVTATNPNGDTATDDVTYNFSAAYAIPPAAAPGSLQGLALANGSITRRVIAPGSFDQTLESLSTLSSGTLTFSLLDDGDPAAAPTILAGNYADFVPRQTLGTSSITTGTSMPMTTVTSTFGGTFLLQSQLAAGAASTANATLNAFHVQPVLSGTIDIRAAFAGSTLTHMGIANSSALTAVAPFSVKYQGARQGA